MPSNQFDSLRQTQINNLPYTAINNTNARQFSFESNSSYSHLSDYEASILRSNVPINVSETTEISVLGQRGIWVNKSEEMSWKGSIPLNQYELNEDPEPEIIRKQSQQSLVYIQELAVRYLKPPTPPIPGEIIIRQESNELTQPAPPLIIRQQPPRPATPDPIVIREAPPQPLKPVGKKVILISGKNLPPPPRKVVIERLPVLPPKPQSIIIERWLPYEQQKRKVVLQRGDQESHVLKPKNVIVQWEKPRVAVKREVKHLGTIKANPSDYVKRYGSTLKTAQDLPDFVLDIKPPNGMELAANKTNESLYELEGDVRALSLVDLEKEGLGEYRAQLEKMGIFKSKSDITNTENYSNYAHSSNSFGSNKNSNLINILEDIFTQVDKEQNGKLNLNEAEKLFIKINNSFGNEIKQDDLIKFLSSIILENDGLVSLNQFKIAIQNFL